LRLRSGFSFLGVASSFSLPFPLFFAVIVGGGGIEVEVDAAVERVTRVLSCRDAPEDASPKGTTCFAASMGAEASCDAGAIEEVEVDAVVDGMCCLTGCRGDPEDPSMKVADKGST
jgi:hypothetical protein